MMLGLIGLGRMGSNMAQRLIGDGISVCGFDLSDENLATAARHGVQTVDSLDGLIAALPSPRIVWVMVPHGRPTKETIARLLDVLDPGDLIIDGGNSWYVESIEHAKLCAERGVLFLDIGVSGGVWGLEIGYNLMIGGPDEAVERLEPVFRSLAPENGFLHVGRNGAGHFVKMIHNAIEYAMLEALGEGFECLGRSDFGLDLQGIAELWNNGSVIRCWLLELLADAFAAEGNELERIGPWIDDSGTGRWTVDYALEKAIPLPTITQSLYERFDSRTESRFAHQVIAALRNQFGGHAVREG
jgi:6-phosphogluconate dehydrogenase